MKILTLFIFLLRKLSKIIHQKVIFGLNPNNKDVYKKISNSLKEGKLFDEFYLQWDEIEIMPGLNVFRQGEKYFVIGSEEEIPVEDFLKMCENKESIKVSTKICQFYLSSIDGKTFCYPVGHICLKGGKGANIAKQKLEFIKTLIDDFNERTGGFITIGGSDGATDNKDTVKLVKKYVLDKYGKKFFHIYDFVHSLKGMRNHLMNKKLKLKLNMEEFTISDIVDILLEYGENQSLKEQKFDTNSLHPSDKMCFSDVQELWKLLPLLNEVFEGEDPSSLFEEKSQKFYQLKVFLEKEKYYYDIFMNQEISMEEKLKRLETLQKFYEGWDKSLIMNKNKPRPSLDQRISSIKDLISFLNHVKDTDRGFFETIKLSSISTLAVELHFSIIRRRVLFPSALEYGYLNAFAHLVFHIIQAVKSNKLSFTLPQSITDNNSYYFNNEFEMEAPKIEKARTYKKVDKKVKDDVKRAKLLITNMDLQPQRKKGY